MLFTKPFPDELAQTHLYRTWVLNDYGQRDTYNKTLNFAKATRSRQRHDCSHPWTTLYTHHILADLSEMSPQSYRIHHTMLVLGEQWRHVYNEQPVKESKTNIYDIHQFDPQSPASAHPFRLCQHCREEDLSAYSMTYWHREHHIAGIDICYKHQTPLMQLSWGHAYSAPNPITVQGDLPAEPLILASAHPILIRYRDIALRVIRHLTPIRYGYAHEQVLARACDMGLIERRSASYGHPQTSGHQIGHYLYQQLPGAWLGRHFTPSFLDSTFVPSEIREDSYHAALRRLQHSLRTQPLFLLLVLATLFETTEEICTLLFEQI